MKGISLHGSLAAVSRGEPNVFASGEEMLEAVREYKPPLRIRVGEGIFAFVITFLLLIIGAIAAISVWALTYELIGKDYNYAGITAGVLLFYFIAKGVCRIGIVRLKQCWTITPSELQFRFWIFKDTIDPISVTTIKEGFGTQDQVGGTSDDVHFVRVCVEKVQWQAYLGVNTSDCVDDLRAVCRNAVYIDHLDKEYLPESTKNPMAVFKALIKDRRRRCLIQLGIGVPILLASLGLVAAILLSDDVSVSWKEFLDSGAARLFFIPVVGVFSIITGFGNLIKVAKLKKKLKPLHKKYPENYVSGHDIDMSDINTEEI